MKKAAILFLISSAFILKLEGQFSIGLTGGINIAKTRFINIDYMDTESAVYYFAGVTPGYHLNEKISFIADIQFSQKGFSDFDTGGTIDSKVRFTYVDLLPQMEYRFHNKISVGAGCNIGYKIAEDYKLDDRDWENDDDLEYAKSLDVGLVGTLKYHISNFHALARINYGLSNISDVAFTDINGQRLDDANIKNTNIQLGLGYTFN